MVSTSKKTLTRVSHLPELIGQTVEVNGWVANKRSSGKVAFIELRDGSGYVQCIAEIQAMGEEKFAICKSLTLESSIKIKGTVVPNEKQLGGVELQLNDISVYQIAEEYPIAKKAHGVDFLMNKRHLWLRSRKQWAVLRVRNQLMYAIHNFFQERGFAQLDAPLLTGNACEGTTTLFETEFYKEDSVAYLSQSGQLYAEATAMAHGLVYNFGPTFRAERSVTPRHLSEFWMIEPEMAFYDLDMDMDLIEEFVKYIVNNVYENCKVELSILERDLSLFENINEAFPRITYEEACKIITGEKDIDGKNAITLFEQDLAEVQAKVAETTAAIAETEKELTTPGLKKGKRNYFQSKLDKLKVDLKKYQASAEEIPQWIASAKSFPPGEDFGSPHERAITRVFNVPVMVYKWPKDIKAFYMKRWEDDPNYVKGVDLLAPEGFGEIVGGSERETDLQALIDGINHHNLPMAEFEWYLDLRRYGSVPHSGFGLGFERAVMWLTGVQHIRETIPFPRYYGRLFP